jgi:hypothetical protein
MYIVARFVVCILTDLFIKLFKLPCSSLLRPKLKYHSKPHRVELLPAGPSHSISVIGNFEAVSLWCIFLF